MKNYPVHRTHWLISTQVLVPVGAGARTGSGLAHSAAALHAVIRCRRGEALAAEPFDRARELAFCLRAGVGVRAAHAVFFVTLGSVSSSDFTCPEALGLRTRDEFTWLASQSTQPYRRFSWQARRRRRPKFENEVAAVVATMQSYYEKHSPRAQRSPTLIIPHANTPLGPVGPIPSSPVPSSPASVQSELEYTASALILLWFLGRGGRRPTSTTRNSARGRSPRRRGVPTSSQ